MNAFPQHSDAWTTSTDTSISSEAVPSRIRAILVDDDDDFREALGWSLEDFGLNVLCLADGSSLLRALDGGAGVDVVVLDWRLKLESGLDVLRAMRSRGIDTPVLFLTGYANREFELKALDQGALDFVDKARGPAVVSQRIRMIAQTYRHAAPAAPRPAAYTTEELVCGRVTFRPKTCRALLGETDIRLTVTEFNIVHQLAMQGGRCVTYRDIYDCVHGKGFAAGYGEDGFRTNVRSAIRRIRNKFAALCPDADFIENVPASGYCWRASGDAGLAMEPEATEPAVHRTPRMTDWVAAQAGVAA